MTAEAQVTCNGCGKTFDEEHLMYCSLDHWDDDPDPFCRCGSDDLTFHKPEEDKEQR